jgi:heme a synthase
MAGNITMPNSTRWLRRGLQIAVLWCFVLVTFGAFVRLSDAGLGCPDWPTCYGKLSWPAAHELVDVNAAFPSTPVAMHKTWPEQVHRHIAAGLGLWVLGLTVLARRKQNAGLLSVVVGALVIAGAIPLYLKVSGLVAGLALIAGELTLVIAALQTRHVARWLTLTLGWIAFQALLGMWTVTLLVKPIIVTSHLLGGLITLGLLLACALLAHQAGQKQSEFKESTAARQPLRRWLLTVGAVLLTAQITLGGWVSTNYAALACPDFPRCQGQWLPEADFKEGFVVWRTVGVNYEGGVLDAPARTAVHLAHRLGAVLVGLYLLGLGLVSLTRPGVKGAGALLAACVIAQILLGIGNVVYALPLALAVAHNGTAALLVCAMIWLIWRNQDRTAQALLTDT